MDRPLVVAVVGLAVLAGCPAGGSPDAAGDSVETVTPAPVPTTARPLPPGVTGDGVSTPTLVDAHVRRLGATSYTLSVRRRVTTANGTASVFERTRFVAAGAETYAGRYNRTVENPVVVLSTRAVEYWTAGTGYATRHREQGRVVYAAWSTVGRPIRDVDRSRRLARTLATFDLRVTGRTTGAVVVSGRQPGSASTLTTPPFVTDPHNATLTARVTTDGLVTDWRYAYDGHVGQREVRVVHDVQVTDVGTTTVVRPAWVDEVRNGSRR